MENSKKNIMVIFGGPSGEHEVSLSSAKGVIENLDKEKYDVIPAAIDRQGKWLLGDKGQRYLVENTGEKKIEEQISKEQSQTEIEIAAKDISNFTEGQTGAEKIDLVLPIIHGPYGEDGRLQGMLEMLGLPYAFSGTLASALAMNKIKTKVLAKNAGLTVLPSITLNNTEDFDFQNNLIELALPLVIKPNELGSSVGISIAKTKEEFETAVKESFKYCDQIMLEKFQKGRELQCAVIGNPGQALPVIEIIPQGSEFYDYKAKYDHGGSKHVCPAQVPADITEKIQAYSEKIFKVIGCKDLARVDFIWDEQKNEIYFLEINTIPGMTPTSLVPEEAHAFGLEYKQLLDFLIEEALKRYEK